MFGSFLVVCALLVAFFIPEGPLGNHLKTTRRSSGEQLLFLIGWIDISILFHCLFLRVNRCFKTLGPSETPADGNTGPTSVPLMHPLSIEEDIAAL